MSEPLFGQCRCGATLTVDHLRNHCPLNLQQISTAGMTEARRARELRELVKRAFAEKCDTTHVAVLGYN